MKHLQMKTHRRLTVTLQVFEMLTGIEERVGHTG